MTIQSYRDLESWQRAMEMVNAVYKVTGNFPVTERYGLSSQLQRSAVSVPSNIAEGHARNSTKEYLRFISIALGSLAEMETQLYIAEQLNLVGKEQIKVACELADRVGMMLRRLQQSLQRKMTGNPEPRVPSPGPQRAKQEER